jgi:hypothetical protein
MLAAGGQTLPDEHPHIGKTDRATPPKPALRKPRRSIVLIFKFQVFEFHFPQSLFAAVQKF